MADEIKVQEKDTTEKTETTNLETENANLKERIFTNDLNTAGIDPKYNDWIKQLAKNAGIDFSNAVDFLKDEKMNAFKINKAETTDSNNVNKNVEKTETTETPKSNKEIEIEIPGEK